MNREAALLTRSGLRHADPDELTITRRRCGRGFIYLDAKKKRVQDGAALERIGALAIPPAYRDVAIAPHADQHLQAIGRDDAGRLQYLYHPNWEKVRNARKTDRLVALVNSLPSMRRRLSRVLRKQDLSRERALAAVVTLIDRTHIRVGCNDYVHTGRSRGAATLLKQNVQCEDGYVRLAFRGKRRQAVRCCLYAPLLARVLEEFRQIPGRRMFQYLDDDGRRVRIAAADVNEYLHHITGAEVTAKDFRTLAATATAAERLSTMAPAPSPTDRKRQVADVMRDIALHLANTPAVVRKSYVHPRLVEAFHDGTLSGMAAASGRRPSMSVGEAIITDLFADAG